MGWDKVLYSEQGAGPSTVHTAEQVLGGSESEREEWEGKTSGVLAWGNPGPGNVGGGDAVAQPDAA